MCNKNISTLVSKKCAVAPLKINILEQFKTIRTVLSGRQMSGKCCNTYCISFNTGQLG